VGGSRDVNGLSPNETATLTLEYPCSMKAGSVTWTVAMDPIHETNDPDWNNNTATETIPIE
jgi:hypothetical protein